MKKKNRFRKIFYLLLTLGFASVCFTSFGNGNDTTGLNSQTYTVGGVSFTMKKVEGGTFAMGAQSTDAGQPNYDAEAHRNEAPVHDVTLNDFWIGETEVTQALWEAVMGTNPSSFSSKPNNPVEMVSWNDVQRFITALNAATGKTFRLPSESEWEYAARGGKQSAGSKYAGSNTVGDVAWYLDNIPSWDSSDVSYGTQAVKSKQANELGLYDMSGNVYEWCQDSWDGSNNYGSTPTDGSAHTIGPHRVIRGGIWGFIAWLTRVSARNFGVPEHGEDYVGFRLSSNLN